MSETFSPIFLLLVLVWPLLLAGATAVRSMRPVILQIASWAALPALLLAVFAPAYVSLDLPWVLLGAELRLEEGSSRLFLLFTALLWLISGIYARAYLSEQSGQSRFVVYFLLSMTGNLGLILAQNLMGFYLFFALMSFASYGLVVHQRSSEALRAGRVYIVLVVIGEIALFSAMLMTANSTGTADFDSVRQGFAQAEPRNLIMLLAFIGFGIKAGVLGLHMWLPLAHPVAPTPASAVLSGAMIKAGLLGWLRLLPLGEMAMVSWGKVFIFLGLATAFYGVIVGLTQKVPKTVLAYSSISQMGIMTMAVGLGLAAPGAYPEILTAVTLFALHHGLNKGALFLGVGVIGSCSGVQRRWVWLALWLPALALVGAPLTSGMAVKYFLKVQTVNAPGSWGIVLQTLLPWSSVATTLLVGRFLVLLFKPGKELSSHQSAAGLLWPWGLLVVASVLAPWWFVPEKLKLWSQAAVLGSLWPVLLGVVVMLAVIIWRSYQTGQPESNVEPLIPPGDLLVPINQVLTLLLNFGYRLFGQGLPHSRDTLLASLKQLWSHLNFWNLIGRFESNINQWPAALIILLILGLVMTVLGTVQ